jgi:hypothetical protein
LQKKSKDPNPHKIRTIDEMLAGRCDNVDDMPENINMLIPSEYGFSKYGCGSF